MTTKFHFRQDDELLEVVITGSKRIITFADLLAIEDDDLAREMPNSNYMESIVYLRCWRLPNDAANEIQENLSNGIDLTAHATSESGIVQDLFDTSDFSIREIYRCIANIDPNDTEESLENKRFEFRWMLTCIRKLK